ncbi:hypothetical protein CCS01_29820 [Rhodopila globiformis]|uniref:Flp family type IVb pilin n=1 Tax=Rhodopila globiformis TaxID=1071 RepID=A0A2S6MW06_RHOGL|nr:hypothetical protein CCS01_29820 [Rhodopila globiformis]
MKETSTVISLLPSMKRALRDRKGVSTTEYVLLLVGISAMVVAGANVMGTQLCAALSTIGSYVSHQATTI